MEKIISETFASILKFGREEFNIKFVYAKQAYPSLDQDKFFYYLLELIEPVLNILKNEPKEKLTELVIVYYDLILELCGKNYLGSKGKYPEFEENFKKVILENTKILIENPEKYSRSIANAMLNILNTNGARLHEWVNTLLNLGRLNPTLDEFLNSGKVISWKSGMAQYRITAIQTCNQLDEKILKSIFNLESVIQFDKNLFINNLMSDPWISPKDAVFSLKPKTKIRMKELGGFLGFGGVFLNPPSVIYNSHGFLVYDTENCFLMSCDIFGGTFHKMNYDLVLENPIPSNPNGFQVTKDGIVSKEKNKFKVDEFKEYNDYAEDGVTLCVTSPLTHSIFVAGMIGEQNV